MRGGETVAIGFTAFRYTGGKTMDDKIKDSSGNVFADLGLEDAEELSQKAALAIQIAATTDHRPQTQCDFERDGKDADQTAPLSYDGRSAPVRAAAKSGSPGCATGREMFSRLARSSPPHEVTTRGLAATHQRRLSMKSDPADP